MNTATTTAQLPYIDQNSSGISNLLGSQNLNPALLRLSSNVTSNLLSHTGHDEFVNPGFVPHEYSNTTGSGSHGDGLEYLLDGVKANYSKDNNSYEINYPPLPELTSPILSPVTSAGTNHIDHAHSPTSTIFQTWEKLMDDEQSESYWKDILE